MALSRFFLDSQAAQSFSCGATKCAYLACFDIYPYCHEWLIEKIHAVKYYTLLFDESWNQINQKKQMDMIVRFWDSESNKGTERYFNSEFMGHATAAAMLTHLKMEWLFLTPAVWCKYLWMVPM